MIPLTAGWLNAAVMGGEFLRLLFFRDAEGLCPPSRCRDSVTLIGGPGGGLSKRNDHRRDAGRAW